MPLTNFPFGVSSFGIPVLGTGVGLFVGKTFFVNSTGGLDTPGRGTSSTQPFKTINYAAAQCKDNRGDLIIVAPLHVETVIAAGGLTIAKAGVTIVGVGNAATRPVIKYTTSTAASVVVTGANCKISNIGFDMAVGALDAVVLGLSIQAAGFELSDTLFQMASASAQGVTGASITAAGSVTVFRRVQFDATAGAGAAAAIGASGNNAKLIVEDCDIIGDFSNAGIYTLSTITNLRIRNCRIRQLNAVKAVLDIANASTGSVEDCRFFGTGWSTAADALLHCTGLFFAQNYGFDVAGATSAVLVPAAGTIS